MLIIVATAVTVHVKQLVQIDVIAGHNAKGTTGTDDTISTVDAAISVAIYVATTMMADGAKDPIINAVVTVNEITSMDLKTHQLRVSRRYG